MLVVSLRKKEDLPRANRTREVLLKLQMHFTSCVTHRYSFLSTELALCGKTKKRSLPPPTSPIPFVVNHNILTWSFDVVAALTHRKKDYS